MCNRLGSSVLLTVTRRIAHSSLSGSEKWRVQAYRGPLHNYAYMRDRKVRHSIRTAGSADNGSTLPLLPERHCRNQRTSHQIGISLDCMKFSWHNFLLIPRWYSLQCNFTHSTNTCWCFYWVCGWIQRSSASIVQSSDLFLRFRVCRYEWMARKHFPRYKSNTQGPFVKFRTDSFYIRIFVIDKRGISGELCLGRIQFSIESTGTWSWIRWTAGSPMAAEMNKNDSLGP